MKVRALRRRAHAMMRNPKIGPLRQLVQNMARRERRRLYAADRLLLRLIRDAGKRGAGGARVIGVDMGREPSITVMRLDPRPELDPMTGSPWSFPYMRRIMTRAEVEAEYPGKFK